MLSIQDLINKAVKEEDRFINVSIEKMKGEIKLRIPPTKEIDELKEKHIKDYEELMFDLVYNCCAEPALNDNKLLEHFNCKDTPYMVVEKVFGLGIASNLAEFVLDEKNAENSIKKVDTKVDAIKN